MTTVLISNNADNLEATLKTFNRTATVEAEYGERVVEGTEFTMAHHGPRAHNMCPCLYNNKDFDKEILALI